VDDLKMLRDLIADEPADDAEARAEVWRRLGRHQPRRRWSQPRFLVLGGVAVAVALATLILTLRSSSVGVAPAEAACPTSASPAQCARAMAAILLPSRSGQTRAGPPRIAVSLFTGFPGRAAIYTMNSRGGDMRRLTQGPGNAALPTWSPDGTRIAFDWTLHWASPGAARGIYVMNADGSGQRLLAPAGWGGTPAWSPGGSKIAFWTYDRHGMPGIYIVEQDGSGLHLVKRQGMFPSWSPDGAKIAYTSTKAGGGFGGIYVMNADGTDQHLLARRGYFPAWSPDGKTIAFLNQNGAWDHTNPVWLMNADGSDKRPLRIRSWEDCQPDWSPAGQVAVSNPAGLFLARPLGHAVTKLAGGHICGAAWQPVGRR
jgi:TolB protein